MKCVKCFCFPTITGQPPKRLFKSCFPRLSGKLYPLLPSERGVFLINIISPPCPFNKTLTLLPAPKALFIPVMLSFRSPYQPSQLYKRAFIREKSRIHTVWMSKIALALYLVASPWRLDRVDTAKWVKVFIWRTVCPGRRVTLLTRGKTFLQL